MNDTIFAPATPPGMGGIAIIRISGPQALAAITHCFVPKRGGTLVPRRLTYGTIQNEQGEWIDEAMVAFLPAPHTYTCEDVAEIQCHGNPSLVNAIPVSYTHLIPIPKAMVATITSAFSIRNAS